MKVEGVITAFLRNGENYLLMKRAEHRRFYPGAWAGIGGHIEEGEENDPARACLREIWEETGIAAEAVNDLKMRYICASPREGYVVIHYIFFGTTAETELIETDEGQTFWTPEADVLGKAYTPVMRRIMEHYFAVAVGNGRMYLFNEYEDSFTVLRD